MKPTLLSIATILLCAFLVTPPTFSDTIVLTNGNKIDGTVVTDERESGGKLVVSVAGGTMFFRASEVASVDTGLVLPPAAPAGNFVEVRLSKGNTFYGSGSYFGIISPDSTDENLVLVIPNAGKITIPRSAVASIAEIEGDPTQPAAVAPSEITTTHAIYMKNGRKIIGTVISTAETEPVKIQIGHLGVLTIPRKDIARIAEEAGTMTLPAEETPAETEAAPAPAASQLPADIEALKEQIKAELLRELLQELLGARVGVLLEGAAPPEQLVTTRATIFGEEEITVQELLGDLTRNRSEYRSRAEARLIEIGPAVLPYIASLIHHPFELTRRAVQRIARDLNAWDSVPIAIEGLNDGDQFVRKIAHETLASLLPEAGVEYGPNASPRVRAEAQAAYWGIWDEEQLRDAKRSVLDRLTRAAATADSPKKGKARVPSSGFATDWRSAAAPIPAGDWRDVPQVTPAVRSSTSPSAGDWEPVPLVTHGVR